MSEEKERGVGCAVAVVVAAILVYAVMFCLGSCAGEGRPEGLRGTLSADWHHAKCAVKFCDEDGRCPVWSSKYSKCYMLDKEAEKFLKKNQKALDKEVFEEVFVK